jgi:16S rRNA (guanine966-N2)-methyltransferase
MTWNSGETGSRAGAPATEGGIGPWPIGKTVAEMFQIRGVLGRGGMGVVYLAHDQATQKNVAIKVPLAVARPTTDFVRQAIFSILGERVANARVLDLFAGSGAIGLEALSRGAASCVFVDAHRQACATITSNLTSSGLAGGHPVKAEAAAFLKRDAATYDLIFADPPYWQHHGDKDHLGDLLQSGLLEPRLAPGGWFIA